MNNKFNELLKKRIEHKQYIDEVCTEELLKESCGEYIEKYKLDMIMISGMTPSFNDGEPCEHSAYLETDPCSINSMFSEFEDYDSYDDHDFMLHIEDENITINGDEEEFEYGTEAYEEKEMINENLIFISDCIYETNYKILIYKNKSGEIQINHEEYYDY